MFGGGTFSCLMPDVFRANLQRDRRRCRRSPRECHHRRGGAIVHFRCLVSHLRGDRRLKDCSHSPHCLHLRIAHPPFERNAKLAFEMPHFSHFKTAPLSLERNRQAGFLGGAPIHRESDSDFLGIKGDSLHLSRNRSRIHQLRAFR